MTATNPASPQDAAPDGTTIHPRICWIRWCFKALGLILFGFVLLCMMGWACLAVYYSDLDGRDPRGLLAIALAVVSLASVLFIRPRRYGVLVCLALFTGVLFWFFSLQPSNDREWSPEDALVPTATIDGDTVTIHNVRNFDYRSETDFTPRWEERTYDLSKLRTVDLMLVFWGPKAIAHAMVSFGFDGDRYLAASIEARRQKWQTYSAVQSFFRQFTLYYIFADERDVVRLRTNYINEDVYLYRSTFTPAQAKDLFLSYLNNANDLARQPEFYNALTSNCSTNVLENAREGHIHSQMSWRVLLNGYVAQQLYNNHRIDTSLPLDELTERSHVNVAANKADQDPDFSKLIRIGLPMPGTPVQGQ